MQYRCPLCKTNGVVPDQAKGHEVRCLKCREKFFIPDQSIEQRALQGLHVAARKNDGDVILHLADSGEDVNTQEEETGHTPLHIAAFYGKLYAVRALLDSRAALEIKSFKTIQTPLFYAARENRPKIAKWLLEAGADPNTRDEPEMTTPLHWCARKGFIDVAKVLVETGADVKAETANGLRPLQFSVSYNQPALKEYLVAAERANGFRQRQRVNRTSKGKMNRFLFGYGDS